MFICGTSLLEILAPSVFDMRKDGYDIVLAYQPALTENVSELVSSPEEHWRNFVAGSYLLMATAEPAELEAQAVFFWEKLLTDGMSSDKDKLEAKRLFLEQKWSKSFSCNLCESDWRTFRAFTTHLDGLDHELSCFRLDVNTDYLDTVTLQTLETRLRRLNKRRSKNKSQSEIELESEIELVTHLIAKKKEWPKLQKRLKMRAELAPPSKRERRMARAAAKRWNTRKLKNVMVETSLRKKLTKKKRVKSEEEE